MSDFEQITEKYMYTTNISHSTPSPLANRITDDFTSANLIDTLTHTLNLAKIIPASAVKYGILPESAQTAALLHNLGRTVSPGRLLETAQEYGLDILPEEETLPKLLHQKLSRIIAVEEYNIADKEILNAISCHTTLKAKPSQLDKLLFIMVKAAHPLEKQPPFMPLVMRNLENSLDEAVRCYFANLRQNPALIRLPHPWLIEAVDEFS